VRTPKDLIAFLTRLREDLEREAEGIRKRQEAGEEFAALSAGYASFTLPDALESLAGWLEDRFTDEGYQERPDASSAEDAEKWREVAVCLYRQPSTSSDAATWRQNQ
jgi:hypothetical protein